MEAVPGWLLGAAKEPLGPEQVRWLFVNKVVRHLGEAVAGGTTFGSDIEFCIADYGDVYPGFDQLAAANFAEAVMLRTAEAVRRGEDPEYKKDLDQLSLQYAKG